MKITSKLEFHNKKKQGETIAFDHELGRAVKYLSPLLLCITMCYTSVIFHLAKQPLHCKRPALCEC